MAKRRKAHKQSPAGDLDFAAFKARLQQRQQALWGDIQRELEKTRGEQFHDLIQQGADPDDRAVADMLVDLNASEITRDVEEFRAVQQALGRIDAGSYGLCGACGRRIDPDRLRAVPETPLCFECQARAEENRIGSPSL